MVEPCHTIISKHGRANLGSQILAPRGACDVAKAQHCRPVGFRPLTLPSGGASCIPCPPARAPCCRSSVVEHPLGKGEVESSILSGSTITIPAKTGHSLATALLFCRFAK